MFPVTGSDSETGLLVEEDTEEACDETGTVVGTADETCEGTELPFVPLSWLDGAEESGCDDKVPDAMSEESGFASSDEDSCSNPSVESAELLTCELMLISSSPDILQAAVMPTTAESATATVSLRIFFQCFL